MNPQQPQEFAHTTTGTGSGMIGTHPTSALHEQAIPRTGNHPTTVDDITQNNNTTHSHKHGIADKMKHDVKEGIHHHQQKSERPVADRNAFIHNGENKQHWQHNMSPAERAKQLAVEMDKNIEQRRRSSGSSNNSEKLLKIGGKKEYKLE